MHNPTLEKRLGGFSLALCSKRKSLTKQQVCQWQSHYLHNATGNKWHHSGDHLHCALFST